MERVKLGKEEGRKKGKKGFTGVIVSVWFRLENSDVLNCHVTPSHINQAWHSSNQENMR